MHKLYITECSFAGAIVPYEEQEDGEFPDRLPPNPVAPERMRQRYRLTPHQQEAEPLRTELNNFRSWMASPVQMDREGALLASRTIQNIVTNVLEYLGFCKAHLQVGQPSLLEYMDLVKLGKFISFHIAKGNSITTIAHHLSSARKVYAYLTRRADARLGRQVLRADDYTSRLTKQLSRIMSKPRADVGDLIEQGTWMSADEVVKLINDFRTDTERLLPAPQQPLSLFMARQLHDSCLTCCMFGYLPPLRLCVLRTLQVPWATKCLHPDCHDVNCKGNRLEHRDGEMYLHQNHFKVDAR